MKIGLKLWSTNDYYIEEAYKLYSEKMYDYIELYIVPDSLSYLNLWSELKIPFIIHAPHSYSGFNPANPKFKSQNLKLLGEVEQYRVNLQPEYIIFHPGINGKLCETINQFTCFKKKYCEIFDIALIENKPQKGLNNEICIGASPKEMLRIINEVNMGFCFDIGHSICYSNSQNLNYFDVIKQFLQLRPKIYHLSDGDVNSENDMHLNFGKGNFDIKKILSLLSYENFLTVETDKCSKLNLQLFCNEIKYLEKKL